MVAKKQQNIVWIGLNEYLSYFCGYSKKQHIKFIKSFKLGTLLEMLDTISVLNSVEDRSFMNQNQLKLHYLQKQKRNLQLLVDQLKKNNSSLRQALNEHEHNAQSTLKILINQNKELQTEKLNLFEKQSTIYAEEFLLEQVMEENQNESQMIMKNYEEKIIDLRKLVQLKETSIQEYESQISLTEVNQDIIVPPYNVSIHFYNEFSQYKQTVESLLKKIKALTQQNQQLRLHQSKETIPEASKGLRNPEKVGFGSDQKGYRENQKEKQRISTKKIQQNSRPCNTTRDNSSFDVPAKQNTLRKVLKKQYMENERLKEKFRNLVKKYEQSKSQISSLIESHKLYQETRQNMIQQVAFYKTKVKQLLQLLMKRKNFSESEKISLKKFIETKDKNLNGKGKNFWKSVQEDINKKMNTTVPTTIKKGRSLSCVCDFVAEDVPQPKYVLKNSIKPKMKKNQSVDEETLFQGISIIGGSKLPGKKKVELQDVDMVLDDSLFD